MEFSKVIARAREIRSKYAAFEVRQTGKKWTTAQTAEGLVGDIGDLLKLVQAKQGIRPTKDVDRKLAHELSDCLWSILVIADEYGIDMEEAFMQAMDELEKKVS